VLHRGGPEAVPSACPVSRRGPTGHGWQCGGLSCRVAEDAAGPKSTRPGPYPGPPPPSSFPPAERRAIRNRGAADQPDPPLNASGVSMRETVYGEGEVLRRARQATWLAGVLAVVSTLASIVRPLVAEMPPIFSFIGVANSLFLVCAWWAMRSGWVVRWAPGLLLGLVTLSLFPLITISGGPSSQFVTILPLFPLAGVMLGGSRLGLGLLVFWSGAILSMRLGHDLVPDLTGEEFEPAKANARTLLAHPDQRRGIPLRPPLRWVHPAAAGPVGGPRGAGSPHWSGEPEGARPGPVPEPLLCGAAGPAGHRDDPGRGLLQEVQRPQRA
jgi:hypothetical protein